MQSRAEAARKQKKGKHKFSFHLKLIQFMDFPHTLLQPSRDSIRRRKMNKHYIVTE